MTTDEEAFLAAIRAAPEDQSPRLIFADWLQERGRVEDADRQREWATMLPEAVAWLRKVAGQEFGSFDEYGGYEGADYSVFTFADIIRAGHDYLDHGEYLTQYGSSALRDFFYEEQNAERYWRYWSAYTCREGPAKGTWYNGDPPAPFSCSC